MSDNILQKVLKTGLWDPSQSIELVALINLDAESASGMLIASILKRVYVPIELRNAGRQSWNMGINYQTIIIFQLSVPDSSG